MNDVDGVIDLLLRRYPAGFRNMDLAEGLGVSRARASQLLAQRILWGELARTRKSRRTRYVRPNNVFTTGLIGGLKHTFWQRLVEDHRRSAYVSFAGLSLLELRTRRQVRSALRNLSYSQRFLIVDFEGVRFLSLAAANELFVEAPLNTGLDVEAINADPVTSQTILRARQMNG